MGNNSQVSKEKASSEPLPKGMIRGFVDGANFALPGLELRVGQTAVSLLFADLVDGHYDNKVAMTIKVEHLGMEVDIPEKAHFEIMIDRILYNDVQGKVKVDRVQSTFTKYQGTAEVKFDGGKREFKCSFDLSTE